MNSIKHAFIRKMKEVLSVGVYWKLALVFFPTILTISMYTLESYKPVILFHPKR